MPDSIIIPLIQLQELKCALDDALLLADPARTEDDFNPIEAFSRVARTRQRLVETLGENAINLEASGDIVRRRQQGFNILKQLDSVRRIVRKDYGLEDAA